ncbi:recombinase family protein [Hyphococcus sp.]|uniref:recombinase family protein n=1 Tax=Hyphococcus sp. TaxID=2038636 RepID=UPI00208D0C90|nr:MAG: recombinase RecB [Marinicaulis sp.]
MKKAAIYARVSTGKQAAGELSLPDQIRRCKAFAATKGFEIAECFVDAGVSVRTDKRAEFQRMIGLACAPTRPFDVVLVHSQSRFARNTRDLLVYKERLDANGVLLHSVTQDLGEGETADVLSTMVGALDEYQSKETAKHVSRSMIENAKQSFWNGSAPPYGYRTYAAETRGARVKKKIEIEDQDAEVVRLIYRLYVVGDGSTGPIGIKQITTYLNDAGYRNRKDRPYRIQYVGEILRNTAYVGDHHYNKRDSRRGIDRPQSEWVLVKVPPIVDEALFYRAQEKLDRQHPLKTPPRSVRSDVLLTSVAKCGACGASMRKQSGKYGQYHYYRCSKKCDSGKTACTGVSIAMDELDDMVLSAIEQTVLTPTRLRKLTDALAARSSDKNAALTERRRNLDGDLRKAVKSLNQLYARIVEGMVELDGTLQQHLKGLQTQVATLKRQIAYLDRERNLPVEALSDERVLAFGATVKAALRNPDNRSFARAYVQTLVSEIVVTEAKVRIKGPNATLMQQTAAFAARGELVPSFAQEWRTVSSKTANWRMALSY